MIAGNGCEEPVTRWIVSKVVELASNSRQCDCPLQREWGSYLGQGRKKAQPQQKNSNGMSLHVLFPGLQTCSNQALQQIKGCPTSRWFFAGCGIPQLSTRCAYWAPERAGQWPFRQPYTAIRGAGSSEAQTNRWACSTHAVSCTAGFRCRNRRLRCSCSLRMPAPRSLS